MELRLHRDAAAFDEAAGRLLRADPGRHAFMLGIVHGLAGAGRSRAVVHLWTLHGRDERCAGAALRADGHPLYASTMPPAAVERLVSTLAAGQVALTGITAPLAVADHFAARWGALTGALAMRLRRLRPFVARRLVERDGPAGQLRPARPDEVPLVADWYRAYTAELNLRTPDQDPEAAARAAVERGRVYLWHAETPRAMASINRLLPGGASIGAVYTPPEHRRRGFGEAIVRALTRLRFEGGDAFCCLYADEADPAAKALYPRVGYRPGGLMGDWHFDPAAGERPAPPPLASAPPPPASLPPRPDEPPPREG